MIAAPIVGESVSRKVIVKMSDQVASVEGLIASAPAGVTTTFNRTEAPTVADPAFYSVATSGELLNVLPVWQSAPDLAAAPYPAYGANVGLPLSTLPDVRFDIAAELADVGDLYRIFPGVYLLTDRLLDSVKDSADGGIETKRVALYARGKSAPDFWLAMPTRLLDVVDTRKTTVIVDKTMRVPNVLYPRGFAVGDGVPEGFGHFVEPQQMLWLWRNATFDAARRNGVKGIYGTPTSGLPSLPKIRL